MAEIREIRKSSIFDSSCQTLVNTVNCVGVMGRGLALEFKMRYPDMYEHYRGICEKGLLRPGNLLLYKASTPWILNFPTKDHWKYPSRLEYIRSGLEKFAAAYDEKGITSIAFPKLGTTAGKLPWEDVKPLMYDLLGILPNLQVEIYHFDPAAKDTFFDRLFQKVHRFTVDDYIHILGIRKKQATLLHQAVSNGTITTMLALQSIPGVGEKTIDAIYNFVQSPAHRVITVTERQMTLF